MRFLAFVAAALLGLSATSAQIPPSAGTIEASQATELRAFFDLVPGVVVTYDAETVLTGSTTLSNLTIALMTPDGKADTDNKVTIARIEAQNLDIDAVQRVFVVERYTETPDQTFRSLASKLTLTDVVVTAKGKPVLTTATWVLDGLQMKPFGFTPGGPEFIAQIKSEESAPFQVMAHVIQAISLSAATMRGVVLDMDPTDYAPGIGNIYGKPGEARIRYMFAELTQQSVQQGRFGRISYKDFENSVTDQWGGLIIATSLEGWWDGIDISRLLPFLARAEAAPITPEPLLGFGASCSVDYTISYTRLGSVTFPEYCADAIDFVWLIPTRVNMNGKGTYTPPPAVEFAAPAWVSEHLNRPLSVELGIEFNYDPDTGVASFDDLRLGLETFGTFDFAVSMGGFQLDALANFAQGNNEKVVFLSSSLSIVDGGGISRSLEMWRAYITETGGVQIEHWEPRLWVFGGIDRVVRRLGNIPEVEAMGAAAKAFMDYSGTLLISMTPPVPLNSAELAGLPARGHAAVLSALGLNIEHTPRPE